MPYLAVSEFIKVLLRVNLVGRLSRTSQYLKHDDTFFLNFPLSHFTLVSSNGQIVK